MTHAISETYSRAYNILELVDIFLNVSFATSETECDITNKMVNTSWLTSFQTT